MCVCIGTPFPYIPLPLDLPLPSPLSILLSLNQFLYLPPFLALSLCISLLYSPEGSPSGDESLVTVQIYLNEGFHGGSTRFLAEGAAGEEKVLVDVVPKMGEECEAIKKKA